MDGRGYGEGEVCRAESGRLWVCHGSQCVPFLETSTTTATTSPINTTRAPTGRTDPMTFPELLGAGFVYKEASEMTWDDARANCRNRGGDLLVTSDFDGLEHYLKDYDMEGENSCRYLTKPETGARVSNVEATKSWIFFFGNSQVVG